MIGMSSETGYRCAWAHSNHPSLNATGRRQRGQARCSRSQGSIMGQREGASDFDVPGIRKQESRVGPLLLETNQQEAVEEQDRRADVDQQADSFSQRDDPRSLEQV